MDIPALARFVDPHRRPLRQTLRLLARAGYSGSVEGSLRVEDLFLDTQGGKLAAAGERLRLRQDGTSWSWRYDPAAGPSVEAPAQEPLGPWPLSVEAGSLPAGAAGTVGGNRLFPVVKVRLATALAGLVSPSGTRLLLVSESPSLARGPYSDERAPLKVTLLTVRLLEGDPSEVQHLAVYLRDFLRLAPEERDACSMALESLGRSEPGGHPPESLRVGPENTLAVVVRKIVSQQTMKMRANTEGTRLDLDPEYLHDLRVATRRLRSALRLMGPVVGARRAQSLRGEISWIGGLLGEVRDLDVFMGNLATHAGRLGEAGRVTRAPRRGAVGAPEAGPGGPRRGPGGAEIRHPPAAPGEPRRLARTGPSTRARGTMRRGGGAGLHREGLQARGPTGAGRCPGAGARGPPPTEDPLQAAALCQRVLRPRHGRAFGPPHPGHGQVPGLPGGAPGRGGGRPEDRRPRPGDGGAVAPCPWKPSSTSAPSSRSRGR